MEILFNVLGCLFLWDFGNFGCIKFFSKFHVTSYQLVLCAVKMPLLNFGERSVIAMNNASYGPLLCYNARKRTCRSCLALPYSVARTRWILPLFLHVTMFNIVVCDSIIACTFRVYGFSVRYFLWAATYVSRHFLT